MFTNPIVLESKKIYYKWELKQIIFPEINDNFQKIINEIYHCPIEEYQDYNLEINSIPVENYDYSPEKVQLIINGFGDKISDNLIINIDINRKPLINIESLASIIAEDVVTIHLAKENTNVGIRNELLVRTIKNFIEVVKQEHAIDVKYGKDFIIHLELPTIENCHDNDNPEIITFVIITIISKGNKIIGQLEYKQTIIYHLYLTNFDLILPPITITLPKKIDDQYVLLLENVN